MVYIPDIVSRQNPPGSGYEGTRSYAWGRSLVSNRLNNGPWSQRYFSGYPFSMIYLAPYPILPIGYTQVGAPFSVASTMQQTGFEYPWLASQSQGG